MYLNNLASNLIYHVKQINCLESWALDTEGQKKMP